MGILIKRKPKDDSANYKLHLQDMGKTLVKSLIGDSPIKVFNANTEEEEIYYPPEENKSLSNG